MIEFVAAGSLRALGKNVELKTFNANSSCYNSIEKLIASVLYRFCVDVNCGAIFIKMPKEGDEPIPGLIYMKDFDEDRFKEIVKQMADLAVDNFGTNDILFYKLSNELVLLVKRDFQTGEWTRYAHECSGKDGISIPIKR